MRTMNYETGFARDREELNFADSETGSEEQARKRRRMWIIAGISIAVLAVIAIAVSMSRASSAKAAAAADGAGKQAPSVSVVVPGRQTVDRIISATGNLAAANFVSGAAPAATLASAQFLYNTASGQVSFDADGTGAGAAVHFVTLVGAPAVTAADFLLVA